MRVKKGAIIVSGIIVAISVTVYSLVLFFGCSTNRYEWFKTIFSGLFTSSFVTFLIFVWEYRAERRKTVEDFVTANRKQLKHFERLIYYRPIIPVDLLINYHWELIDNKIAKSMLREPKYDAKEALGAFLWEKVDESLRCEIEAQGEKSEFINSEINIEIEKNKKNIDIIAADYIRRSKLFSIDEIEFSYGSMDFFKGNKKYRKEIAYQNIYMVQIDTMNKVLNACDAFEKYLNDRNTGEDNNDIPRIIDLILQLQSYFLIIEDTDLGQVARHKYVYEIESQLRELLILIYGKKNMGIPMELKDYGSSGSWLVIEKVEKMQKEIQSE